PSAHSTVPRLTPTLWALCPVVMLAPALACVAPRSMAALYIASAIFAIIAHWYRTRRLPAVEKHWLYAVAAFTGYVALSQLWTINPEETLGKAAELGGMFLLAAALHAIFKSFDEAALSKLGRMLATGFWLGVAVYFIEQKTHYALYDLVREGHDADVVDVKTNKPAYLIALWAALAFPFFWRRAIYGWVSAAMALVYVVFTAKSMSVQVVLAGLPVLWLALKYLPVRFNLRLAALGTIALAVLMPLIAMYAYTVTNFADRDANGSITSRIEIWNQAAQRVREHPLLGWGLDSASKLPNRGEISVIPAYAERHMGIAHLHPHNMPMQIWFELGGVGVAAFCAFVLFVMTRIEAMPADGQRYAIFMWAILFLNTLASWGIWQSWFIASLAFAAVVTSAGSRAKI
ncbi:MAG: O-antigen ligase family protein, partial [Alphaproteobacteria bacterium]|nr:O-antigen ligase family protein [Alphaproteobacteria bacterium]